MRCTDMAVWQWFGLAVAAAVLCMVVRVQQPQMASVCAAAAGLMLLGLAFAELADVQKLFERLSEVAGLKEEYLKTLLKAVGVSYAAELASQLCTDLGENGLAVKVGMAGKWCVLTMTAPLMMTILEMILELVP